VAYDEEIHPPEFLAFARDDGKTTTSFAFAVPYRTTQLYNLVQVNNRATKPFPEHFKDNLELIFANPAFTQLEAHVDVEPLTFDLLKWEVCAPVQRPPQAELKWSSNFTTRTGVVVAGYPNQDTGCVTFLASEGSDYVPMAQTRNSVPWPWSVIDQETAPTNVRAVIDDKAGFKDNPAAQAALNKDPLVDSYADLSPTAGAGDAQPFPFFGTANVWWEIPDPCAGVNCGGGYCSNGGCYCEPPYQWRDVNGGVCVLPQQTCHCGGIYPHCKPCPCTTVTCGS
jgi:hypothetical protein